MALERVQKILAQTGIASRRKAEDLIREGEVTINGKVASLGDKADLSTDSIKVGGKLLRAPEAPMYIAFHKPKGVISMMEDPEGRATLAEFLTKVKTRVFPIGRLDFNSEGLILLTNDGDFAEKLQRREDIPRAYQLKLKGHPDEEMLERLRKGARLEKRTIKPHSVRMVEEYSNKSRIEVVLMGGGAMDIKKFAESRGFLIERVVRTAIGHITLHGMMPGQYRILKKSQVDALLDQPELGLRVLAEEGKKRVKSIATSEEDRNRVRGVRTKRRADEDEFEGGEGEVHGEGRPRPIRVQRRGEGAAAGKRPRPVGSGFGGGARGPRKEFGERAPRGERSERGGFGSRAPRGEFGGEKRGGFGAGPRAPRGPRRDFDGEGRGGEKRGGFGAGPRGPRKDFGDRAPRKDFGGEKRGGFGASRGPRAGGEGRPQRGPARGPSRGPRSGGSGGPSRGGRPGGFSRRPRG